MPIVPVIQHVAHMLKATANDDRSHQNGRFLPILQVMSMSTSNETDTSGPDSGLSETTRSVISLFLVLHLICVFWAVTSNFLGSPIQLRVSTILRPYIRTFNLETSFAEYPLTYGDLTDANHRIEVLPEGRDRDNPDDWVVIPDRGFRGTLRYHRYHLLADSVASFLDADEVTSAIAVSVAKNFKDETSTKAERIRCRRHLNQPLSTQWDEAERDPNNEDIFFDTVYEATLKYDDDDGSISPLKVEDSSQTAKPGENNTRIRPTGRSK